jgi:hypothetical protein
MFGIDSQMLSKCQASISEKVLTQSRKQDAQGARLCTFLEKSKGLIESGDELHDEQVFRPKHTLLRLLISL